MRSTWKKQALPSADVEAMAVPSGENVAAATFCQDHRPTNNSRQVTSFLKVIVMSSL